MEVMPEYLWQFELEFGQYRIMLLYKLNQLSSIQYSNNIFVFSVQHV